MDNNTFRFKLVDIKPFSKKGDNTKMARIIAYCSYGFVVNLFTTEEKANVIKEKAKTQNNDITSYVYVFYDNDKQKFAFVINSK